jgi:hypothetical protein
VITMDAKEFIEHLDPERRREVEALLHPLVDRAKAMLRERGVDPDTVTDAEVMAAIMEAASTEEKSKLARLYDVEDCIEELIAEDVVAGDMELLGGGQFRLTEQGKAKLAKRKRRLRRKG